MAKLRERLQEAAELLVPERLMNFHPNDWGTSEEGLTVLRHRWNAARAAWSQTHGADVDELPIGRRGAASSD